MRVGLTKVLFLCTGNSASSQMAEALLRRYAGDRFEVHSAGLEPKGVHPLTVRVMSELGIDMAGQRAKDVSEYVGRIQFDYVVTVCSHAEGRCPVFPAVTARLHWPFDDPAALSGAEVKRLRKFREVRDHIDARIRVWLIEQGILPMESPQSGHINDPWAVFEPGLI